LFSLYSTLFIENSIAIIKKHKIKKTCRQRAPEYK